MNVVISGSASLQEEMKKWVAYWNGRGVDVLAWPDPIAEESFEAEWSEVHRKFYEALYDTDILFVANVGKGGINGYIGPNVFAEIAFAVGLNFVREKKIRVILINTPSEESRDAEALRLWMHSGWMELFDDSKSYS